jgi:hypothetical protein
MRRLRGWLEIMEWLGRGCYTGPSSPSISPTFSRLPSFSVRITSCLHIQIRISLNMIKRHLLYQIWIYMVLVCLPDISYLLNNNPRSSRVQEPMSRQCFGVQTYYAAHHMTSRLVMKTINVETKRSAYSEHLGENRKRHLQRRKIRQPRKITR